MNSAAEERIRTKVVEMMRTYWPDGRIIHELQTGQMEHRLDVACVTPDRLVLAEIKSELDVIKRAESQLLKATSVADEVWLCVAEKHENPIISAREYWKRPFEEWEDARETSGRFYKGVKLYVERSVEAAHWLTPAFKQKDEYLFELAPLSHARFDLLWAEEMRFAMGAFFGGATIPGGEKAMGRGKMIRLAVEHMSGRELRRVVCAGLRARHFPRADPPVRHPELADE